MSQNNNDKQGLKPEDERLLDLLIEAEFDPDAVKVSSPEDSQRLRALTGLFGLLDDYPVDDADDSLVDATILRVRRAEDREHAIAGRIQEAREKFGLKRLRLPDLISIAAVLLIVASVGWPMLNMMRRRAVSQECVANLTTLGDAFAMYANDWDGRVPIATAGFGGTGLAASWVDPFPLAQLSYCPNGHANCPGHSAQAGYSRQLIIHKRDASQDFSWFTGQITAIMGDRNPVIDARAEMSLIKPTTNSQNHDGLGQNILNRDNSTQWLEIPVLDSDDNIWLIRGRNEFTPGEAPVSADDVFLAH